VGGVEVVREALRLLLAHKLRSLLTLFGLVWGTAAVIFLVGWGRGVRDKLELGFFKAGRNMGEVWAGRVSEEFTPAVDRRFLWFTPADVEHRRRVVLVGDLVRRRLLGPEARLGTWIRIGGIPFQVVGLLAPVGTQLSADRLAVDEQVWVPISTVFTL